MTPCEELGYVVGDKFTVSKNFSGFEEGQTVELYRDEGDIPLFLGDNTLYRHCDNKPGAYLELIKVSKIMEENYKEKKKMSIEDTLKERDSRYGSFYGHALITQNIKTAMRNSRNWNGLSCEMKESLEMVAHKIGRILNGDPLYKDSWHDIIGYTKLIEETLED